MKWKQVCNSMCAFNINTIIHYVNQQDSSPGAQWF